VTNSTKLIVLFLFVLTVLCSSALAAEPEAQEPSATAWVLSSNNWQQGEKLLPPPVLERLKNGDYSYKVLAVPPEQFRKNYSDRFWEATKTNAGRYDVDPETCGLKDIDTGKAPSFYYGHPFPEIDPKDANAACKLAWNFTASTQIISGGGATSTLNGIDSNGEFKRIKLVGHLNYYQGRAAGPIENRENLRFAAITNILEPRDVDGVAGLTRTINDWTSEDQAWFYIPATRRVRRVNAAMRSDPVGGLDIYLDDLNCYGGKVEYYKWRLAGEGTILAPVLGVTPLRQKQVTPTRWEVTIPYFRAAYETPGAKGAPWQVVENLTMVPRPVWILEGESKDPYYSFGKVIMYMDKEMFSIYWKLVHNRAGEYFYNAMCAYHWSTNDAGDFRPVTPNMVIGVNDKTNRAAIGGRYISQFIETDFRAKHFSLPNLARLSE
jgi:hypothetical protein